MVTQRFRPYTERTIRAALEASTAGSSNTALIAGSTGLRLSSTPSCGEGRLARCACWDLCLLRLGPLHPPAARRPCSCSDP
eukprot:15482403-Alexandrium_andersonii.AAC.1